jgi:predicted transcriptional regulator
MNNLTGDSSWRFTKPEKGERKPRREKVHREVLSIRLTPDTLEKVAILASQQEERTSRNMLIESIIEDYVKAAFPEQEVETTPVLEEAPTDEPAETEPTETPTPADEAPQTAPASPKPRKKRNKQA